MANLTKKKKGGDESSDKENRDSNAGLGGGRGRRQAPGRTAEAGTSCGGGGRIGIDRFEFVRYLVEHEDRITFQVRLAEGAGSPW
jgi:hypothetical protein